MEDMIYIEDLLKFYLKRIGIVIFITLLFLEIGLLKDEKSYQEYYQESTTIILVNPVDEEGVTIPGAGSLDNYLTLLESKKLAANVISNLQLDISTSALLNQSSFVMSSNSQMITITVTDANDELAASIANTYVSELKKEVNSIYRVDNIMVLDAAIPSNNVITSKSNSTIIFALAGFVITSGIIISIYCFNDNTRIMLRKEPVLGVEILKTLFYKKKSSIYEKNPKNEEKLQKIKSLLYKLMKENQIKTIMITSDNNKFHSNYSVSLASAFTEINKKTILIDCNSHGKLSDDNESGILDLITSSTNTFSNHLKKYIKHISTLNLDILPLGNLEKNSIDLFTSPNFSTTLEKIKEQYDVIFVEVPDITTSFEGMILSDLMDATIVVMKKNQITTTKIQKLTELIDPKKNKFIAVAPVKKKRSIKIKKMKKISIPKKIKIRRNNKDIIENEPIIEMKNTKENKIKSKNRTESTIEKKNTEKNQKENKTPTKKTTENKLKKEEKNKKEKKPITKKKKNSEQKNKLENKKNI